MPGQGDGKGHDHVVYGPGTTGFESYQPSKEREFQRSASEINPQKGEDNYQAWFNNAKLTYDSHLDILTTTSRRSQDHYDALVTGERSHRGELERISLQALQNAVETANMVGKQSVRASENAIESANFKAKNTLETANLRGKDAVRHSQIATDQQWNMEPQEAVGEAALMREVLSQPAMAAIQAAIVKAVGDAVNTTKK